MLKCVRARGCFDTRSDISRHPDRLLTANADAILVLVDNYSSPSLPYVSPSPRSPRFHSLGARRNTRFVSAAYFPILSSENRPPAPGAARSLDRECGGASARYLLLYILVPPPAPFHFGSSHRPLEMACRRRSDLGPRPPCQAMCPCHGAHHILPTIVIGQCTHFEYGTSPLARRALQSCAQ